MAVTGVSAAALPAALACFGIGLTAGNLIAPRFADKALMPTAGALLVWSAVALALYPFAAGKLWSILLDVTAVGFGGALGTVMQTRLMDVAGPRSASWEQKETSKQRDEPGSLPPSSRSLRSTEHRYS